VRSAGSRSAARSSSNQLRRSRSLPIGCSVLSRRHTAPVGTMAQHGDVCLHHAPSSLSFLLFSAGWTRLTPHAISRSHSGVMPG
jgi:hypothetical protein